jgi:hypothetical protein
VERNFDTFVGIDLGGTRGKTTAVAVLRTSPAGDVSVDDVSTRSANAQPWVDDLLVDFVAAQTQDRLAIAINAPLTVPACVRCREDVCPGQSRCVDPAVVWLRTEGQELVRLAHAQDLNRIAAVPAGRSLAARSPRLDPPAQRLAPYVHRCSEVRLHFEQGLLSRDCIGAASGPISARAAYLVRLLARDGFRLNHNVIEVSPRATVHALFDADAARGYKRDADPWHTRARIVEGLGGLRFSPRSRLSREEVLRNDHCFEAMLSAYTAYLWTRDGWELPTGTRELHDLDGFVWAPPAR